MAGQTGPVLKSSLCSCLFDFWRSTEILIYGGPSKMVGDGAPGDRAHTGRAAASARPSGVFSRSRRAIGRRGPFSMPVLKRPACACRRYVCVLRAAGAARTGWAEDQQDRLEQFVKKFPRTACLAALEQVATSALAPSRTLCTGKQAMVSVHQESSSKQTDYC